MRSLCCVMIGITVGQILVLAMAREDWITSALALLNFASFIGYIFVVHKQRSG